MELIEGKIQKIAKEMEEANANHWTITKIIKELTKVDISNEKMLRKKALELLETFDPNAAKIYSAFSKMQVHTSNETIENFDRGNIIKSLLKETSLSRSVAEKITQEVENQIKDSRIDFLSTALIRELVNTRLINYGFEKIRNNYTRVGQPVYNVKKELEKRSFADETTREYNLISTIPKEARDKHFKGDIFIEDIKGFSNRPFAYSFIAKQEKDLNKTLSSSIKQLVHNRKYFFHTPNLYGLTFAVAKHTSEKQVRKNSQLIKEMLTIPEGTFTNSLELFISKHLENLSEYKLTAAQITNNLLDTNSVLQVDSKYSLKLIDAKEHNLTIINNSNEEYFGLNNGLFSPTQGIDLFVNINLEKLARAKDEDKFFLKLENTINAIKKLEEIKKKELEKKKYLANFKTNEMKTGIGLTNILAVQENFEGRGLEIANRVYKKLSSQLKEEVLFPLGSKNAKDKFETVTGKEIYSQETLDFEECLASKKCCFTGKAHTLKEVHELIDKKIKRIEYIKD